MGMYMEHGVAALVYYANAQILPSWGEPVSELRCNMRFSPHGAAPVFTCFWFASPEASTRHVNTRFCNPVVSDAQTWAAVLSQIRVQGMAA
jgi:hypothetical protein